MDGPALALTKRIAPGARDVTLSQRWWGIDWAEHLPWSAGDITIEWSSFEAIGPFLRDHAKALFSADEAGRWTADPMTEAKRRFVAEADIFAFVSDQRIVGYLLAHPTDWTTYYCRSIALLPEYRGRGVLAAVDRGLCGPLVAAGVQRMEGDIAPTNAANLIGHMKLGWVTTGHNNSDRWGSLLRLTRHLHEEMATVFRTQFCVDTRPPRRKGSASMGSGRSTS